VLDHVLDQLQDVTRKASGADRAKIEEYTTSVREVEQRLAKLNKTANEEAGISDKIKSLRPADGLPNQLDEHAKLMSDVLALAFQTDRTRIATMLLTNNLSGQVYPFLGLRDDHHSFSHSWQGKEFASITRFWVEQYAYLLKKLDSMQEGSGTVLDNCCIMLANEQWTAHDAPRVPLLIGGGMGGALKTGRSLDYETSKDRKLSGLLMTVMDRMGAPVPKFGGATEPLAI
jgi:hypothetical protein